MRKPGGRHTKISRGVSGEETAGIKTISMGHFIIIQTDDHNGSSRSLERKSSLFSSSLSSYRSSSQINGQLVLDEKKRKRKEKQRKRNFANLSATFKPIENGRV
jgi:hypothetical protein